MTKILLPMIITLLLICHSSLSHAGNIFVFVAGIQGESTDAQHPGWVEAQSSSWGHGEAPPGSPAKVQFSRLNFTKVMDSTSATFALLGANGGVIPEVKVETMRNVGPSQVVAQRIRLLNVRVANYQAAAGSAQLPVESIALSFASIAWFASKIDPAGKQGTGSTGCWDVLNNKQC